MVNSLNSAWPNLAGQKAGYLKAQITAFRDGKRTNPQMQPFVNNLSDETIAQLARHYAAQAVANKKTVPLNQAGRTASAYCISCHGKQGKSVNEEWPNIAGQQQAYLETQLLAFRDDSRTSPLMQVIAKELTKAQISDVAEFYSQIAP